MPVEAADDAFFDCPGAALLLSRLYHARCYQSGRVAFSLRSEGEGIRSRKALGNWWQELKRINDELGEPFFDPATIERHGREGMSMVLKQPSKAAQERPGAIPRQDVATQQRSYHQNNQNVVTQWEPNKRGDQDMATQWGPEVSNQTTQFQPNPNIDTQMYTQTATQREPNPRLDQEISNSGSNSLASKQASSPARPREGEEHFLEQGLRELTGFTKLPQHWARQVEEWRLARYPDGAYARLLEWAWEVRASEGRVPGRGALTKTLRAIAREWEEGKGHDKPGAEQQERPPAGGVAGRAWRRSGRGEEERGPETLAELKARVRAKRAGVIPR